MRKISVTYPVRLNRFQTQADLLLEQAILIEKNELDLTSYFPPDETDLNFPVWARQYLIEERNDRIEALKELEDAARPPTDS